jgi:hypothetical protein
MEHHGCVGERFGWRRAPATSSSTLLRRVRLRLGLGRCLPARRPRYYPKLVIASPYTPATGLRILTGDSPRRAELAAALIQGSVQLAERLGVSGLHWLFTDDDETEMLRCRRA